MAARKILQLDEDNRTQLQRIVKRSSDWRERERAQTLLRLDSGLFAQDVADQLGLNVRTVRTTHIRWRHNALASLPDKPRSGAPQKLNSGHVQRLVQWALDEPLTATALLARHLYRAVAPACMSTPWWPSSKPRVWCGSARAIL